METSKKIKSTAIAAVLLVVAAPILHVAYYSGLVSTLGHASSSESYKGMVTTQIDLDPSSFDWGIYQFYFLKGQEVFFDYDLDIRSGEMQFTLDRGFLSMDGRLMVRRIGTSGTGRVLFRIPESGLYGVDFGPVPAGQGYDVTYSVYWGLRS